MYSPENITTWSQNKLIDYYDDQFDRLCKLYIKMDKAKNANKKLDYKCEAKVLFEHCQWLEQVIKSKK